MATYLITGGAGFIGSHIVKHLIEARHRVRVLDNFCTGSRESIPEQVDVIEDDIRNAKAVHAAARGVDYVLHLAAQISVPLSIDDPVSTDEINSRGTLNVLMAAKSAGAKRFVLSSSCAVYGDNPNLPLSEDCLPAPLSPYAITKLAGEHYCRAFHHIYGMPTVALRYLNVFGPGQRPDSQYAAVIPKFIDAIVNDRIPTIYGDGEQTRDFVYVDNIVQANLLACQSDKAVGRVINVASGVETSLNQLLEILSRIAGRDTKANYAPERAGDIRNSVGDPTLAKELLSFQCEIGLEEGLKRTFLSF
jgi:nucleoside-diphosphate-sugar epimerase